MKVVKMSISMDPELGERARLAAERSGQPLSQWIADAVDTRLRAEALRAFIAEYEVEEGAFTTEELAEARGRLGLPASGATPA